MKYVLNNTVVNGTIEDTTIIEIGVEKKIVTENAGIEGILLFLEIYTNEGTDEQLPYLEKAQCIKQVKHV